MDIGDLVYVIFVLMSIVFGVFGKKKKKSPETDSNNSNAFDLESFIRDAYDNTNEDAQPKEADFDEVNSPSITNDPHSTPSSSNFQNTSFAEEIKKKKEQSKTRVSKVKSKSGNSPIFENEISDTAPSSEFEFDAQKAVIYSEILKRPNY